MYKILLSTKKNNIKKNKNSTVDSYVLKLRAVVYDILPSTVAVFSYVICF